MGIIGIIMYLGFLLFLTIVIEVAAVLALGKKDMNFIYTVIMASVLTNPILNTILMLNNTFAIGGGRSFILLVILEIIVIFVEYKVLQYVFGYRMKNKNLLFISIFMNSLSFIIGYITEDIWHDFFYSMF